MNRGLALIRHRTHPPGCSVEAPITSKIFGSHGNRHLANSTKSSASRPLLRLSRRRGVGPVSSARRTQRAGAAPWSPSVDHLSQDEGATREMGLRSPPTAPHRIRGYRLRLRGGEILFFYGLSRGAHRSDAGAVRHHEALGGTVRIGGKEAVIAVPPTRSAKARLRPRERGPAGTIVGPPSS